MFYLTTLQSLISPCLCSAFTPRVPDLWRNWDLDRIHGLNLLSSKAVCSWVFGHLRLAEEQPGSSRSLVTLVLPSESRQTPSLEQKPQKQCPSPTSESELRHCGVLAAFAVPFLTPGWWIGNHWHSLGKVFSLPASSVNQHREKIALGSSGEKEMSLRVCTWILHLFPSVFYSLLEYVSFLTHPKSFLLSFLDYPCSSPVLVSAVLCS